MNSFIESRYAENIRRLALGLEPLDFARRTRIAHPISITFDAAPYGPPRSSIQRHNSCLHALSFFDESNDRVEMNLFDATRKLVTRRVGYPIPLTAAMDLRFTSAARRFVPRRISFPLLTASAADAQPFTPANRIRRPALFPGAGYDVSETATGIRARVMRNGQPMRWARVEATLPGVVEPVGRAHGDDRGEFLLLLDSSASPLSDLENPLTVQVTVFGPTVAPVPATPEQPKLDPLWDLPLETASAAGLPDPVSAGQTRPATYISTLTSTRPVDFILGKLSGGIADFIFS